MIFPSLTSRPQRGVLAKIAKTKTKTRN